MIKIIFVIPTLNLGGAEMQTIRTINALDVDKFDVEVIILKSGILLANYIDSRIKIKIFNLKSYFDILTLAKSYKYLFDKNPDIIHSVMYVANLIVRFCKIFRPKVKIINHIHGLGSWIKWHHIYIDRISSFLVNKYILVSQASYDLRLEREGYSEKKMELIYNSINCSEFSPNPRLDNREIILGTACRIIKLKNISQQINFVKYLIDNGLNVKLSIAGEGPEMSSLIKQVNLLKLSKNVDFLGYLNDMPNFMRTIDVFILTSVTEDMPLSIFEAFAAGLPVISSDVGGVKDVISLGSGMIYNNNDSSRYDKITKYLMEVDLLNASEINRSVALNFFDTEIHIKKIENLYFKI